MKVSGLGSVRGTVSRRGGRKVGGSASFDVSATGSSQPAPRAAAVSGPSAVGALLAIQETGDPTGERARGLARGGDLLRELEQIRLGLLMGTIPRARLERLTRMLREKRNAFADPQLNQIVEAIEVRAAVELAKFERSGMTAL